MLQPSLQQQRVTQLLEKKVAQGLGHVSCKVTAVQGHTCCLRIVKREKAPEADAAGLHGVLAEHRIDELLIRRRRALPITVSILRRRGVR